MKCILNIAHVQYSWCAIYRDPTVIPHEMATFSWIRTCIDLLMVLSIRNSNKLSKFHVEFCEKLFFFRLSWRSSDFWLIPTIFTDLKKKHPKHFARVDFLSFKMAIF